MEYNYKWEDRSQLDALYAKRENVDDILIVKNGLITDTLYANIAFEKSGQWFTTVAFAFWSHAAIFIEE